MKFISEKKSSLCIYTDTEVEYSVDKMECELQSLRRELEGTRDALRLQTVRCRQLVAAFTTKLQDKESEVRSFQLLKDRQLSQLLRALLVLEARLRREQRSIREQLSRKDSVIRNQQREIARLRARNVGRISEEALSDQETEENSSGSLQSSPSAEQQRRASPSSSEQSASEGGGPDTRQGDLPEQLQVSKPTAFVRFKKNNQSKTHHTHRIFKSIAKQDEGEEKNKASTRNRWGVTEDLERYRELERLANTLKEELDGQTEDDGPLEQDEELPRDLYKDYQHNPVLECVNQILLRDHDECVGEGGSSSETVASSSYRRFRIDVGAPQNCDTRPKTNNEDSVLSSKLTPIKNLLNESPSGRSDGQEEFKVCGAIDKRLSPHLNEKEHPNHAPAGTSESEDSEEKERTSRSPSGRCLVPPALPPKPPQLGSKSLFLQQKKLQNSFHAQSGQHSQPSTATLRQGNQLNVLLNNHVKDTPQSLDEDGKTQDTNNYPGDNHSHQNSPEKPRQRQILSNGSLIRALNQENGSPDVHTDVTGNGHLHLHNGKAGDLSPVRRFKEKLDSAVERGTALVETAPFHPPRPPPASPKKPSAEPSGGAPSKTPSSTTVAPTVTTNCGAIKVGSSVSSLITGSLGDSIVTELTLGQTGHVPLVSSLVRRFEHLQGADKEPPEEEEDVEADKDSLQKNFEEFRLEDVDMDSVEGGKEVEQEMGRPEADGAETRKVHVHVVPNSSGGNYEHFLETTGLSQKSILTPSRMYSNHRSVLKPKDVKHRSKVLRAQAVGNGPVVKYWMEPFL